jgi:hypothetical protein
VVVAEGNKLDEYNKNDYGNTAVKQDFLNHFEGSFLIMQSPEQSFFLKIVHWSKRSRQPTQCQRCDCRHTNSLLWQSKQARFASWRVCWLSQTGSCATEGLVCCFPSGTS